MIARAHENLRALDAAARACFLAALYAAGISFFMILMRWRNR
jgi:hypothetical protein